MYHYPVVDAFMPAVLNGAIRVPETFAKPLSQALKENAAGDVFGLSIPHSSWDGG